MLAPTRSFILKIRTKDTNSDTRLFDQLLTPLELSNITFDKDNIASSQIDASFFECRRRWGIVVSQDELGTSNGKGLGESLTYSSGRALIVLFMMLAQVWLLNILLGVLTQRHTSDDSHLVLESAFKLLRVDEGVDIVVGAGGELGFGGA